MDIRSSLEGLKTLLGGTQPTAPVAPPKAGAVPGAGAITNDLATLSSAGSEVSQTSAEPEARMDKVASIQSALASGTYNVPASAVAPSVVSAMMGNGK
jgi:negative regulator of flagellin synthesis FlgM